MRRSTALALAAGVLLRATGLLAQHQTFPNTKQRGRATVEYKDDVLQVVASYDYSQRSHESSWLLIDLAASMTHPGVLHRDNVTLVTPSGSRLMVAAQRRLLEDSASVRSLLQNAKIWRQQLESYFNQRSQHELIQFLAFPGEGLAIDSAVVADDRVTMGRILFETREGWNAGTYSLIIDLKDAHAELPISLE